MQLKQHTNSSVSDSKPSHTSIARSEESCSDVDSLRSDELTTDVHDNNTPGLIHNLRNRNSILALAVGSEEIYAGTQDGEIVVWSLASFEIIHRIKSHSRSILCLHLSKDGKLLFSSAGDAIVNVWCPKSLKLLYHVYSTYDVGDVFSVAYSPQFQTIYLGSQNTSIQWCSLKDTNIRSPPNPENHPDRRNHRFFDSVAAGGTSTPRSPNILRGVGDGTLLEINKSHMQQYAHFGYVYCMLIVYRKTPPLESENDFLISGGGDGTIKIWELSHNQDIGIKEIACLGTDDAESVLSIALDDSYLYSSKLEGVIELWDLDTQQKVRVTKTHDGHITTLQIGWDFIFSASSTGFARKHSTTRHNEHCHSPLSDKRDHSLSHWKAHEGRIMASALKEYNGQRLFITGASDKIVSIWEITGCAARSEIPTKVIAENQLIKSLRELVSFKTISSNPDYAEDCWNGASYLRRIFKKNGAVTKMLTINKWNPVVYAKFKGNPSTSTKRKKILFYGHYDVVPAENKQNNWITDPFKMKGVDGYLYGRGVSDNKGPILAALYGVVDLIHEKELESDITFLIEGEEESGSRGFKDIVQKHKDLIGNIDYIIIANSYWINDEIPCLTYGLRGVLHATIMVDSKHGDIHSGVDGSFMMDEPLFDLTATLAKLKRKQNRVMIPGFYDNILPLTQAENARFDDITETLTQCNPEIGPRDLLKASLMARWREPSLTIHRYKVSGPDGSLVSSHASAAISLRLVPNQEVEDVTKSLISFLTTAFTELNTHNHLSISIENQADAWLGDPENVVYQTLEEIVMDVWSPIGETGRSSMPGPNSKKFNFNSLNLDTNIKPTPATSSSLSYGSDHNSQAANLLNSKLVQKVPDELETNGNYNGNKSMGRKPLYIREGGSIPSIRFLEKEFGAPAAQLPCGQASDSAHLENERLRVINLYKSRDIFRRVFRELPRK